ncbi:MAG: SGNH/GDSL hydrolase family protein [Victivallaceae bacterium]|nr:SGNH/GDSL hydrolase family protein [Victivallaceae bacterium]
MKKNYTVVFQGDSITDAGRNYGQKIPNREMGNGYAALLAAQITSAFPAAEPICFNRGISGNRVVDLYARWKIDALNLKPDFLSILIGVNDTWHEFESGNGVEVPRYERIYRELLEWTRRELPATGILLIEPFAVSSELVRPEWLTEIAARQQAVRRLAKEFSTLFVSDQWLKDAEKEAPGLYWLLDGVHPTYAGHRRLADAWWKEATKEFLK